MNHLYVAIEDRLPLPPSMAAPSVNIIDADANYTGANRSTVNQIDDAGRWAAIATSPPLPQQHKRED